MQRLIFEVKEITPHGTKAGSWLKRVRVTMVLIQWSVVESFNTIVFCAANYCRLFVIPFHSSAVMLIWCVALFPIIFFDLIDLHFFGHWSR